MKTSVLITGGSGFIGRNLAEALAPSYTVLAPRRQELDLLDADSVKSYLRTHPVDVLIHSATTPGHRNAKAAVPVFDSNLKMFFNLAAQRKQFGQWINLGSGSEYDMRFYQPKMVEEYFGTHIPVDAGGFSKYISSRFLETDVSAINLRLFGVFGKYEDYSIRFISNAICKAIFDLPITIKQNRCFDYLYIEDLPPVITHFIEHPAAFRDYNVTPDHGVELLQLAKMVRDISSKDVAIVPALPGLGIEYSGNNGRLRAEFPNFRTRPIRQAVESLYQWYVEHKEDILKDVLLVDK